MDGAPRRHSRTLSLSPRHHRSFPPLDTAKENLSLLFLRVSLPRSPPRFSPSPSISPAPSARRSSGAPPPPPAHQSWPRTAPPRASTWPSPCSAPISPPPPPVTPPPPPPPHLPPQFHIARAPPFAGLIGRSNARVRSPGWSSPVRFLGFWWFWRFCVRGLWISRRCANRGRSARDSCLGCFRCFSVLCFVWPPGRLSPIWARADCVLLGLLFSVARLSCIQLCPVMFSDELYREVVGVVEFSFDGTSKPRMIGDRAVLFCSCPK